jgi:hypothetical protein
MPKLPADSPSTLTASMLRELLRLNLQFHTLTSPHSATNVLIDGFTIFNGDDAVAIQAGAKNVTVRNGMASGPGCHGMSIGSLGQNQGLFASVSK